MTYFYTYVLFSLKDHRLYIGFTTDLEKRVHAHNEGLNKSTRPRRPLKLIYFEGHTQRADALRREAYFKTTSGKKNPENNAQRGTGRIRISQEIKPCGEGEA